MGLALLKEDTPIYWKSHAGPQTEALTRNEFEVLYGGSRGGGKTDAGLATSMRNTDHPRYRFLVIRKNAEDLSDWLSRARMFYATAGAQIVGNPAYIKFPSGAIGKVGHLKDDNAFDKYQGHEYHLILLEELTQISKEERYLKLLSSCRTTIPELKPRVFCTTNPGGAGHLWVKNRFIVHGAYNRYVDPESGRSRIFIPSKVTDNPTLMLNDPSYVNYLKSLPEKLRKAWLDGNWDVFEGQFFDSWDSSIHVCEPFKIPDNWKRYISIDYGYSAPSAVLWYAVAPDGRTYQYRELYQTGLTFECLRDEILRISEGESIQYGVFDPALKAKSQGTGVVGAEVLNTQKKIKFFAGDNNRLNGWTKLREYYRIRTDSEGNHYSLMNIFKNCHATIRTVPELVHDQIRVEDLDTDGEDHCADSQRYFVMSRPAPGTIEIDSPLKELPLQQANFWKAQNKRRKEISNGSYL